jgi:hypothetical protein
LATETGCLATSREVSNSAAPEVVTIGLVAGVIGTAVAASLAGLLDLELPAWEMVAISPISIGARPADALALKSFGPHA